MSSLATPISTRARRFLDAPWLTGIDDSARWALWQSVQERVEPIGAPLLQEGCPNDRLWFVESGAVAVERARPGGQPAEVLIHLNGPAVYGTTTFFRASTPTITLRVTTPIQGWTLDRAAYDQLRTDHPDAAEALALLVVQVLAERFDQMDRRISELMADHQRRGDHPRANEWADFRNRLFEEPTA